MPIASKKIVFLVIAVVLCLTSCRSTPDPVSDAPADRPTDEMAQQTAASLSVADLLPIHTAAVAAFRVDEIHTLAESLPALDPMLEMILGNAPFPPALQDILQSPASLELDAESPVFLAFGLSGHEEFFEASASGATTIDEAYLPDYLHLRLIVTAPDAEALQQRLIDQCLRRTATQECTQFVHIEARQDWVTVDMALSPSGQWLSEVDHDLSIHNDGEILETAAWDALHSEGAALALHTSFDDLFDLRALFAGFDMAAALTASPDQSEEFIRDAMTNINGGYLFDSPEVAEFADVTFRLENHEGILTLDAVGTLTEYGKEITTSLHRNASISAPASASPAVDLQWGFDLRGARQSARHPRWAQSTADDESSIQNRLLSMRSETPQAFLLSLVRSPATTYALFDELFGEETTPSDFSRVQGLRMQLGLQPGSDQSPDIVATMGLDLLGEEDLLPYEQFSRAALLPFGSGADVRALPRSPSTELQTAIGITSEDAFSDNLHTIDSGVRAFIDLTGLRTVYAVLEGSSQPDARIPSLATLGFFELIEVALPLTATIPTRYQQIRVHALIQDHQSVFRVQFGGDQLIPIQ